MIYTVTFNPAIDYVVRLDRELQVGDVNRARGEDCVLAHTNFAMMPEIETVFLATAIKWSYLSSTIVREAAHYGQDVSRFVPRNVERALIAKREAGEL